MLINLSNHPSAKWPENQINVATQLYGNVVDLPFPNVDPTGDEEYITNLANEYLAKVLEIAQQDIVYVHIMGEMTLTHKLVNMLSINNITCIASTTQRIVEEGPAGEKIVTFRFERFRRY